MSARYRLRREEDNHIIELNKHTTLIGRSQDAQITFENPGVSNLHASLERNSQGWRLTDLGSTNGTWVNEQRIQEIQLSAGDRIQFNGSIAMVYETVPGAFSDLILDPESTIPGNIAEILAETQGTIAAVERTLTNVREEQSEARQQRLHNAEELRQLKQSFELYRDNDTKRFDRLTKTLEAIAQSGLAVGSLIGFIAFATITADHQDRRGPIAKAVDWAGGPGESISLVTSVLLGSAALTKFLKRVRIQSKHKDTVLLSSHSRRG